MEMLIIFYYFPIKTDIVTKPEGGAYEIPRLVTWIWESRLREDFEYDWKLEVLRNFGIEGLGKWDQRISPVCTEMIVNYVSCSA